MVRLVFITLIGLVIGCGSPQAPELHVLKVRNAPNQEVVFVQVSNPAKKAMLQTQLQVTENNRASQAELKATPPNVTLKTSMTVFSHKRLS